MSIQLLLNLRSFRRIKISLVLWGSVQESTVCKWDCIYVLGKMLYQIKKNLYYKDKTELLILLNAR